MAKKNEEASEEVFYVGLSNPQEMRRNVLESMKDTILVLKTYDHLSKKRAEKVEKIIALKQVLGDIDALLSKVRRRLPKTRLRTNTAEVGEASQSKGRATSTSRSALDEVGKLEAELAAIEDKLGKL